MIEINLDSLYKGEKRIRVKGTMRRKAHMRTIKEGKGTSTIETSKTPAMEQLDIKTKLNKIMGKEKVNEFQDKISGMSKDELVEELSKLEDDTIMYREKYLEAWTRSGRDLVDGYITEQLELNKEDSRLEEFFDNPLNGPFSSDDILAKSIMLNQERLRLIYPDGVMPLYRGLGPGDYDKTDGSEVGDEIDIRTYNIASWTEYQKVSSQYASLGDKGLVVKVNIPIENVLWSTRLEGPTAGRGKREDMDGFEYTILHGGYQKAEIVERQVYEKRATFDSLYDLFGEIREEERNEGKI